MTKTPSTYLDDKLGHPTKDPHGKEIPEDFVHLTPGATVKAALLREGREGEVVKIGSRAQETDICHRNDDHGGPTTRRRRDVDVSFAKRKGNSHRP